MSDPRSTILAIGAAGQFAGLVVPALAKRGATVRGLVRNLAQADLARRSGAAEVVIGDLTDRANMDAALRDVDSVFYIAPAFLKDEAKVGVGLVAAARNAGVRRIVFSSVIHPTLSALVNHAAKAPVEEAILTSGMEHTILQPTMFFQNFAPGWATVAETGVLAEPWVIESRFTRVDYRDVAEVAAIALTEDRLLFGTFQLCAEGNLDRHDVAALMSAALGRPIRAEKLDTSRQSKTPDKPLDEDQAAAMKAMTDFYDRQGLLGSPLVLRAILGREPRTLRAYFEELAAATRSTAGNPAIVAAQ